MSAQVIAKPSPLHLLALAGAAALLVSACESDVTEGGGGAAGTTSQGGGGAGAATSTGTGQGGAPGGSGAGASGGGTAGAGGGVAIHCNPTPVTCNAPTPVCPPGQVPSVEGYCWGECVPILSCATEPNCDNCQGAFCAEYQGWTVEYRCVLPSLQCSALACSCLAPYFCLPPFDACVDGTGGGHVVSCGCPTC